MTAAAPALPAVGDRVEIDARFMGVTIGLEVIVVEVDAGPLGPAIVGRPDGAVATFRRREWREVAAS